MLRDWLNVNIVCDLGFIKQMIHLTGQILWNTVKTITARDWPNVNIVCDLAFIKVMIHLTDLILWNTVKSITARDWLCINTLYVPSHR